jgi:hypothetical protein
MDARNPATAACAAASPLTPTLSPGYGGEGVNGLLSPGYGGEGVNGLLSLGYGRAGVSCPLSLSRLRERVGVRVVECQEMQAAR